MQVVILAGGLGTRLIPVTYKTPKVMVEIDGAPFLYYLLELFKRKGFKEILMLVGYLGKQIESYFGNGDKFGLSISYSLEQQPLGTGGALKNAQGLIGQEFILVNGDTYLDFDYSAFLEAFYKINKKGLMCVYTNNGKEIQDNVLMDNSIIIKYDRNNSRGLSGVDAGILVFKKDILQLIPENKNISLEDCVYRELIRQKAFSGFTTDKKFLDIGNFQRLKTAKDSLK